MKEKLFIIDGNSILNRAFYALPYMTNSDKIPLNAVYGFANMMLKLISDYDAKNLIVCFDHAKKTFRNEIYAEYKGTRKPAPDDLVPQFKEIRSLLDAFNIKRIEMEGFEADDLIGSIAKKYQDKFLVNIISGDRDLFQLVDDSIQVLFTKKGISDLQVLTNENIVEVYGVLASQVVDLKAIMGDKSDNIPGVKGIGEVGAKKLINEWKNLQNIYENIEQIKGATKTKLEEDKESAFMSQKLATINTNVEVNFTDEDFKIKMPFSSEAYMLIGKYEFNSILKKTNLFELKETPILEDKREVIVNNVGDEKSFENMLKLMEKGVKFLSIYFDNNLSISFNENEMFNVCFGGDLINKGLNEKDVFNSLKKYIENEDILKIVFHKKELYYQLKKYGVDIRKNAYSLSLAEYLISGIKRGEINIATLLSKYDFKVEYLSFAFYEIYEKQNDKLKNDDMLNLYYDIELPLVNILIDMEETGFKIDKKALLELKENYSEKSIKLRDEIIELAGCEFNVNSPKQLGEILFDKLELPNRKKGSTDLEVLEELEGEHKIISYIKEYRKVVKFLGYIEGYILLLKDDENIINTTFNQTLTSTGRLSSSEPNLQNIPIRSEEGKKIREIFISRFNGGKILSADYSQIELRLLAHYSNDKHLVSAYKEDRDVHAFTASLVFGCKMDEVTHEMRSSAKTINFGIMYGMSEYTLSKQLNVSVKEAKKFINNYFENYIGVKEFMEENIQRAKEDGYTSTLFNRRRYVPELNSTNYSIRQFGVRATRNMPFQGTASDIIKIAMIRIFDRLKEKNFKSKLILQIHDELIFDVYPEEEKILTDLVKQEMENVIELNVPLVVNVGVADTLLEAH